MGLAKIALDTVTDDLIYRISESRTRCTLLSKQDLVSLIEAQAAQIEAQTAQITSLMARIAELEARLSAPPKTPDNSEQPPPAA